MNYSSIQIKRFFMLRFLRSFNFVSFDVFWGDSPLNNKHFFKCDYLIPIEYLKINQNFDPYYSL